MARERRLKLTEQMIRLGVCSSHKLTLIRGRLRRKLIRNHSITRNLVNRRTLMISNTRDRRRSVLLSREPTLILDLGKEIDRALGLVLILVGRMLEGPAREEELNREICLKTGCEIPSSSKCRCNSKRCNPHLSSSHQSTKMIRLCHRKDKFPITPFRGAILIQISNQETAISVQERLIRMMFRLFMIKTRREVDILCPTTLHKVFQVNIHKRIMLQRSHTKLIRCNNRHKPNHTWCRKNSWTARREHLSKASEIQPYLRTTKASATVLKSPTLTLPIKIHTCMTTKREQLIRCLHSSSHHQAHMHLRGILSLRLSSMWSMTALDLLPTNRRANSNIQACPIIASSPSINPSNLLNSPTSIRLRFFPLIRTALNSFHPISNSFKSRRNSTLQISTQTQTTRSTKTTFLSNRNHWWRPHNKCNSNTNSSHLRKCLSSSLSLRCSSQDIMSPYVCWTLSSTEIMSKKSASTKVKIQKI